MSKFRQLIIAANPPFSLDKWGADKAAADPHKRFARGVPTKSKADYAFILLVKQQDRGGDAGAEEEIRRQANDGFEQVLFDQLLADFPFLSTAKQNAMRNNAL